MAKLNDLTMRRSQHICIYGDPKTGKSTLAASAAKAGFKLLWFSFDNGHDILFKLPKELHSNIDVIRIPDTKTNPIGIVTLLKVIKGGTCRVCDEHGRVDCAQCKQAGASTTDICLSTLPLDTIVVFDHASQIADSAKHAIWNKRTAVMPEDKAMEYKFDWDDWGVMGTLLTNFLSALQQGTYHSITIAHVCETKLEDGNKKLVPQIGTDKFSGTVAKYFDHVIFCKMENKSHKFGSSTTYSASAVTGSRGDISLENAKVADDISIFFDPKMIEEERKKEVAKVQEVLVAQQVTKVDVSTTDVTLTDNKVIETTAPKVVMATPEQTLVATSNVGPTPTNTAAVNTISEAAKERLAKLRGLK